MVNHPSTNRAQCRLTTLIEANVLTTTLCCHTLIIIIVITFHPDTARHIKNGIQFAANTVRKLSATISSKRRAVSKLQN